ncbi:translation elongation factor Ts [Chloroflexota bacterium]
MEISTEMIKDLRDQCGAGIMDCRNTLVETGGDMEKALQILKEKGILKAEKKAERETSQGLIEAYIHAGGRIGAMVEVNCETDFVARTDEFKELTHNIAMQVAAMCPQFISKEEIPEGTDVELQAACLLHQPFIKDLTMTVQDTIVEAIAKVGENIKVRRFTRFELGN